MRHQIDSCLCFVLRSDLFANNVSIFGDLTTQPSSSMPRSKTTDVVSAVVKSSSSSQINTTKLNSSATTFNGQTAYQNTPSYSQMGYTYTDPYGYYYTQWFQMPVIFRLKWICVLFWLSNLWTSKFKVIYVFDWQWQYMSPIKIAIPVFWHF